jgi:hypothetical protein
VVSGDTAPFDHPHQVITWILRKEYINGETFTMGGNSMRLEKIERLPPQEKDKGAVIQKTAKPKKGPERSSPLRRKSKEPSHNGLPAYLAEEWSF